MKKIKSLLIILLLFLISISLVGCTGSSKIKAEKFEKAFNAGTIDPRIKPEDYQKIQDFYDSGEKEKTFRFSVSLPGKEEQLPIRARIVKVGDESNNVKYILNIELAQ